MIEVKIEERQETHVSTVPSWFQRWSHHNSESFLSHWQRWRCWRKSENELRETWRGTSTAPEAGGSIRRRRPTSENSLGSTGSHPPRGPPKVRGRWRRRNWVWRRSRGGPIRRRRWHLCLWRRRRCRALIGRSFGLIWGRRSRWRRCRMNRSCTGSICSPPLLSISCSVPAYAYPSLSLSLSLSANSFFFFFFLWDLQILFYKTFVFFFGERYSIKLVQSCFVFFGLWTCNNNNCLIGYGIIYWYW